MAKVNGWKKTAVIVPIIVIILGLISAVWCYAREKDKCDSSQTVKIHNNSERIEDNRAADAMRDIKIDRNTEQIAKQNAELVELRTRQEERDKQVIDKLDAIMDEVKKE